MQDIKFIYRNQWYFCILTSKHLKINKIIFGEKSFISYSFLVFFFKKLHKFCINNVFGKNDFHIFMSSYIYEFSAENIHIFMKVVILNLINKSYHTPSAFFLSNSWHWHMQFKKNIVYYMPKVNYILSSNLSSLVLGSLNISWFSMY